MMICYHSVVFFDLVLYTVECFVSLWVFFFQAEDGIRDLVRSRGLGDVYKRQLFSFLYIFFEVCNNLIYHIFCKNRLMRFYFMSFSCLLYTSDAADERSSVDLGGRRIIKKKNQVATGGC